VLAEPVEQVGGALVELVEVVVLGGIKLITRLVQVVMGAEAANGGAGGAAGSGGAGVSNAIYLTGGTAPGFTNFSCATNSATACGTIPVASPIVSVDARQGCTNSEIVLTKTSGTWGVFGPDGTFVKNTSPTTTTYTNTGAGSTPVAVYYTGTGDKDVIVNGVTYTGLIKIKGN
jgi:hypothetical protein